MADRFHFNPDTGRTGKCEAKKGCRFGQSEDQHGASREDARANYEKHMEGELFSNTSSSSENGSKDPERRIEAEELDAIKDRLRTEKYTPQAGFYSEWKSTKAQSAVIRTELDSRGIDSSRFTADQLSTARFYVLNGDGNRIVKVTNSQDEAESKSWGIQPPLLRKDVLDAGAQKLEQSEPGDSMAAAMMEEELNLEESGKYPVVTPKIERFTKEQLDSEAEDFVREHNYGVAEILELRGVDDDELDEAEHDFGGYVTVKIPSGSEADISVELARRELKVSKISNWMGNGGGGYRW